MDLRSTIPTTTQGRSLRIEIQNDHPGRNATQSRGHDLRLDLPQGKKAKTMDSRFSEQLVQGPDKPALATVSVEAKKIELEQVSRPFGSLIQKTVARLQDQVVQLKRNKEDVESEVERARASEAEARQLAAQHADILNKLQQEKRLLGVKVDALTDEVSLLKTQLENKSRICWPFTSMLTP